MEWQFSLAEKSFLVFDGVCNLCVAAVKLLRTLDRHGFFSFVPYQTLSNETIFTYRITADELQGQMHLVLSNGALVSGAGAISEICGTLSPIGFVCRIFRTTSFQNLYAWLASRRYRIFGCRKSCYLMRKQRISDS